MTFFFQRADAEHVRALEGAAVLSPARDNDEQKPQKYRSQYVVGLLPWSGVLPGDYGERPDPLGGGLSSAAPHCDLCLGTQLGHV